MKATHTLTLLSALLLGTAGPLASESHSPPMNATSFVQSEPRPARIRVTFERDEDPLALRAAIAAPDAATEPDAITLSADTAPGITAAVEPIDGQAYRIAASANGVVRIAARPGLADRDQVGTTETHVFIGDFGEALANLADRFDELRDAQLGWDYATRHEADLRSWVAHWLETTRAEVAAGGNGEPVEERVVTAYTWAVEIVDLLETRGDTVAWARGRQLPARQTFTARTPGGTKEVGFDFILRLPAGVERRAYPLLVIIHGHTSSPYITGAERPEIEEAAGRLADFPFITASLTFNGVMRDQGGWAPDEVAGFVETFARRYPVDRDRIYLTGFSMGGMGTNRTVAHRPDLFAAVAPLCGYHDPEWAAAAASVPAYIYHGDEDGAVTAYQSHRLLEALQAEGARPQLFIYEGVGHPVWDPVYREPKFYLRLLQHERRPPLGAATIAARPAEEPAMRLETVDVPALAHPHVAWMKETVTAADLRDRWGKLRGLTSALERLYPHTPITGELLCAFPDGIDGDESVVHVGIALAEPAELPEGMVDSAVESGGSGAVLRHVHSSDDLVAGVDLFRRLHPSAADQPGVLLQVLFSDHLDGTRYRIWNLKNGPGVE